MVLLLRETEMKFDRKKARDDLFVLADTLEAYKVPFFLIQGTALGAFRDGGFTPTEKDIDIGVLRENLPLHLFQFVAGHLNLLGYDTETVCAPFRGPRTLVVHMTGCKADVVSFMRHGGDRFAASPVRDWLKEPYCIVHEAELLEPPYRSVVLFGRKFNVPDPIEKYLEAEYGPDWRVPKEDHVSKTRRYDYLNKEGVPL